MATMHGGLIAAAIDTTCGVIVRSVSKNQIIPTINLNVNYLSPGMAQDALLVTAKTYLGQGSAFAVFMHSAVLRKQDNSLLRLQQTL